MFNLQTLFPGANPTQLVYKGQPCTLVNLDVANTVQLSDRPAFSVTDQQGIAPLGPLNSASFNGSDNVWGSAAAATVVGIYPYGYNWSPSPAQAAAQINALGLATHAAQNTQIGQLSSSPSSTISQDIATNGTPLLHGANVILSGTTYSPIPAGGSVLTSIMQVHKPGYFITLVASPLLTGSTVPFITVQLYWYADAGGTETVSLEQWTMPTGQVLTGYAVMGRGFTKGNYLKLQFFNLDPSVNAQMQVVDITETTQHIARDDWRVQAAATVTGYATPPNSQPLSNLLSAGTLNPGNSFLLPLYAGEADLCVNTMIAGQTMTITSPNLDGYLPAGLSFYQATGVAGNVNAARIILPRFPVLIGLSGAAGTVGFSLTALEYAS